MSEWIDGIEYKNGCAITADADLRHAVIRPGTVPAGVIGIDERAFAGCQKLRSVSLSAGLKAIGECAFAG